MEQIRKIIREEIGNVLDSGNQMIDGDDKPIVFYHGSKSEFDTFDKSKIGSSTDPGWLGEGFYF